MGIIWFLLDSGPGRVYYVAEMHIETVKSKRKGKTYTYHYLRQSYRDGAKVRHREIANLSHCSDDEIAAIRLALKHKHNLEQLCDVSRDVTLEQGLSVGAVWLLYDLARETGIEAALGKSRDGKLALWQVIARVIDQGSRLSAVRLAGHHAACDVLGFDAFHEDHLYANLDWLAANQAGIEDRLARDVLGRDEPGLYLYDVTSSYLEGTENAFAAFGYNRDGKRGKRQIVIGLLCDETGRPLSIEVFAGNTPDVKTFASQVRKVAGRFGGGDVTFVGDRGMIKSRQIEDVVEHGFHYITAITKAQIRSLLKERVLQRELFESDLAEVRADDGVRYILRRNPFRAVETRAARDDKLRSLREFATKRTEYLAGHSRAKVDTALRHTVQRCEKLRLSGWASVKADGREISIVVDENALARIAELDGCYVLKTDLAPVAASKETIHGRYKDLALVEQAFRTSKTVQLEMRPIHVRLKDRTRGHAFVVMLAYLLVRELAKRWRDLDVTVQEGIDLLGTLCATRVVIKGKPGCNRIPNPAAPLQRLLDAARVTLPEALPDKGIVVATRKKLPQRRRKR